MSVPTADAVLEDVVYNIAVQMFCFILLLKVCVNCVLYFSITDQALVSNSANTEVELPYCKEVVSHNDMHVMWHYCG